MFEDQDFSKLDQEIDHLKDRIKGLEDLKVSDDVFDRFTLLTLYEIVNKGYIDVLYGAIKTGKESNVFLGRSREGLYLAVKIHRMVTSDFNAMLKYIEGDRRFKKIKKSRRSIILTWVEKEYQNLKTAYENGVKVPFPVVSKNNVVVMEFIGEDSSPAPMLKNAKTDSEEVFKKIVSGVKKLYQAKIVHGDLSEYNILMKEDEPYIIDLSQGVPLDHPMAEELLIRDVKNLSRFFGKKFDKVYRSIIK